MLVLGLLAFRTQAGIDLDTRAYRESLPLTAHWRLLYERGYKLVSLVDPLGFALLTASVLGIALARRRRDLVAAALFVTLGAALATESLKAVVHGARGPFPIGETGYPSGHATAAAALAIAFTLVAPRRLRLPVALIGAVLAVTIGLMLVTTSTHRPSDVVAGFLVAGAFGALSFVRPSARAAPPRPR